MSKYVMADSIGGAKSVHTTELRGLLNPTRASLRKGAPLISENKNWDWGDGHKTARMCGAMNTPRPRPACARLHATAYKAADARQLVEHGVAL